ncbi:MAG TPA: ABC transporter permease [Terriglobales bacterium]|nr:ABC transporter permease [Terriglobales bacterium]
MKFKTHFRHFAWSENIGMALKALRENKVRSLLTVLGVVIGVTTLLSVSAIMVGLDQDMRGMLENFGADTLFVYKFTPGIHLSRPTAEERARKPLTYDDGMAIQEQCHAVKWISVEIFPQQRGVIHTARYQGREVNGVNHTGAIPSYEQINNLSMAKGRFFSQAEDEHRADVVVIGSDIADTFFASEDPLGKTILVDSIPYQVIGVEEKRKGQFFKNQSADRAATVPYHTYEKHHPANNDNFIAAAPYPGMKAEAEDEIREVLRRRRKVPYNKPDTFGISSADEIATQFHQITGKVALITFVLSSIGLMIGGVGVMNIMLMSVTERTREIGVRKAIGARRRDIIGQFLAEAITLTGAGGVIGVIVSFSISVLINAFLPSLPSSVPMWAVVTGVVVSMSVGLFFGIYPAVKAARLDPVDALRYE